MIVFGVKKIVNANDYFDFAIDGESPELIDDAVYNEKKFCKIKVTLKNKAKKVAANTVFNSTSGSTVISFKLSKELSNTVPESSEDLQFFGHVKNVTTVKFDNFTIDENKLTDNPVNPHHG